MTSTWACNVAAEAERLRDRGMEPEEAFELALDRNRPPGQPRDPNPPAPKYILGSGHPNSKLNDEMVRQILLAKGTNAAIALRFGVTAGTISAVRNRRAWAHVPDPREKARTRPTERPVWRLWTGPERYTAQMTLPEAVGASKRSGR